MSHPDVKLSDTDPSLSGQLGDTVGFVLRTAREKQKLSIDEVANHLCIRPIYIHAIENSDYDRLPAMVYTRGFVKSYADYLKLESAALVERFRAEAGSRNAIKEPVYTPSNSNKQMPSRKMIYASLAGAVVLIGLWGALSSPNPPDIATDDNAATSMESMPEDDSVSGAKPAQTNFTPPEALSSASSPETSVVNSPPSAIQPPAQSSVPSASQQPSNNSVNSVSADNGIPVAAANETVAVPTPSSNQPADVPAQVSQANANPAPPNPNSVAGLALDAVEDAWVEITDSNENVLYRKVLRSGETLSITGKLLNANLSTGNAGGLAVRSNGKRVGVLGRHGEVVHGITLDSRSLTSMAR